MVARARARSNRLRAHAHRFQRENIERNLALVEALPPVAGALFQEVIDLAVILNALPALRG